MNQTYYDIKTESLQCINCITGAPETVTFSDNTLLSVTPGDENNLNYFCGPGLIDLQINGIRGIDFNVSSLTVADLATATQYLLGEGVTSFFPTIITNADDHIITLLRTIASACKSDALINACIKGVHLEGPFISPLPGAKGAHNELFVKAPDWDLFCRFQEAAEGRIKIITLAPEWDGSAAFIRKCVQAGVIVSIGHSLANEAQIRSAVDAGARMSTHLGNGVPLQLPRHPNLIWDQLAEERLHTCIIGDGIHLPDSFVKVVLQVKGSAALLVSDATSFAGMEPGEYEAHIGGSVVLDKNKRISLKAEPRLLAGAAKTLLEDVETMQARGLCALSSAWQMASSNVLQFLDEHSNGFAASQQDLVVFTKENTSLLVQRVVKQGKLVYRNSNRND